MHRDTVEIMKRTAAEILKMLSDDRSYSSYSCVQIEGEIHPAYSPGGPGIILSPRIDIPVMLARLTNFMKEIPLFENRIFQPHFSVLSPNDPFSEEEAAGYLKLPVDSVKYYATRTSELAYCDFGRGRRTYIRKDLDAFLEKRREPSIDEKVKARPRKRRNEQ